MATDKVIFRGVLVPVLTPFRTDLQPDLGRFTRFCKWLLAQGAGGLAVFGTTSEANSLSIDERIALLEGLLEAGIPAARLMPGTGCCSLADSIRLTRHAVDNGCGGVLMLPPFYYKGVSDDGLYASYSEVIQRIGDSRLQLYLYHIPQMTAVPISLNLIGRLLKAYPQTLAGIKDSSGNWDNTLDILKNYPHIATFPSSESRLLEALQLGGAGCISASANINVAAIAKLAARWQEDDAAQLHDAVSAVRAAVEAYPLIPALKTMMAHYANDDGWTRLRPPLTALTAEQSAGLLKTLQGMGYELRYKRS
jgi:4-hydroxy-tetrahydrodipicolinate synthase